MRKGLKRYGKVTMLILGLAVSYALLSTDYFHAMVMRLAPVAFISELVAGALYTSFVTIPVALSMMSILANDANIYVLAIVGGFGALLADSIILKVIRRTEEAFHVPQKFQKLKKNTAGKWVASILGILALASPAPDEVAMGILGISKVSWRTFVFIVYPIKAAGIFIVLYSLRELT